MTRVEAVIRLVARQLERMKAEGMIPPGYEANIVLRNKVRPAGHLHIGETSARDLSTALSELIDNPNSRVEIEVPPVDPGKAGLAMARHMRAGNDLPLCGQ